MREFLLTACCRLENLALIGAAAGAAASVRLGRAGGALVELAVTEVCSNVMRHGHPREPDHEFTLRLRDFTEEIEIEIRDAGAPYSSGSRMPEVDVPLAGLPEGGFGTALVARTMDRVEHARVNGVNIVRLVKRCAGARAGDAGRQGGASGDGPA